MKALSNLTNNSIAPFMEDAVWHLHLQGVYGGDHVGVQHAVTVLHVVTLRRRHDVIRMDLHGAGQGGRVGGGDEVIPAVVHPFPVVYPVPVAACAVIRAVGTLAAVFPVPVALPFPVGAPLCAPEAPGCGGL